MRAATPFRYLLGDLDAAREIAASPRPAVLVGFLFVASAALAREYDGAYLLDEPHHVVLPFVASLGASSVMFVGLWLALLRRGGPRPPFIPTYDRWLALFLWTAPLAWVYAIPWERLLDPVGASVANLCTLAVVAVWRVVLMVSVGSMLLGAPRKAVASIILGVSGPVVLMGLLFNAAPLFAVMGGVRLEEGVAVAAKLSRSMVPCALLLCPLLALGALTTLIVRGDPWQPLALEPPPSRSQGALAVALGAILVGVGLLAVGQSELRNARDVEDAFWRGDLDGALRLMSARDRSDFPPHWAPPPSGPWADSDRWIRMAAVVERSPTAPAWLRAAYRRSGADAAPVTSR